MASLGGGGGSVAFVAIPPWLLIAEYPITTIVDYSTTSTGAVEALLSASHRMAVGELLGQL